MKAPELRAVPLPVHRLAILVLIVAGSIAMSLASTAAAAPGVSGQIESWEGEFGVEPGELFNPRSFGVDPRDGSVYIVSKNVANTEAQLEKFTSGGVFEGSAPISLQPEGEVLEVS